MSPGIVFTDFALLEIPSPVSITYKLWIADINIVDVLLLLLALSVAVNNNFFGKKLYLGLVLFISSSIIGFLLLGINGFNVFVYFDSVVYSLRLLLVYYIASNILKFYDDIYFWFVTVLSAAVFLALISIIMHFAFNYSTALKGRVNTLGMGVNITAEFFTYVFVVAYMFRKRNNHIFLICLFVMTISLLVIFMTGSRRALVVLFFVMLLYVYRNSSRRNKMLIGLLTFISIPLFFTVGPHVINFLSKTTNLSTFQRLSESLIVDTSNSKNIDGRVGMYLNSYRVFLTNPFGLGNSDWLIQDNLSVFGTGSHTHNFFIQNYFKYGLGALLLIYPLVKIFKGIKNNTLSSYLLIGIMINQFTGVGFWNIKYLFLVTIFFVINLKELEFNEWRRNIEGINCNIEL